MYFKPVAAELSKRELEAARLGFKQLLRRKRFSPRFIEQHGDDLLGTASLEYSRKVDDGADIQNPTGWLIACAWRRTQSQLEAEGRRPEIVSTEVTGPVADETGKDPEDALLSEDRVRKVREAVEELPVEQRRVVALSYFEGMTVREAARALDWHPSKAQRAHEAAKRRLQELLGVDDADALEIEIGLAAYGSVAAHERTRNVVERAVHRTADGLASLKQQVLDGGAQLKQHATSTYYRVVDPTPLAAARPGTVASLAVGCVLAVGGGATYCVEQGMNPIGAARGLIASSSEPESPPPSEPKPDPSPGPVYTPEPTPAEEEAPAPEATAEPEPTPEPQPEPKPKPEPTPEESFEPDAAYASSEGASEETSEAPEAAPVESSEPAPAPARPGPQFGGP